MSESLPPNYPRKKSDKENWTEELISRIAFAGVVEQRRARRWSIFFKFLLATYLLVLLFLSLPREWHPGAMAPGKHTAIVRMEGVIAADSVANANNVISGLKAAFKSKSTAGVILYINSPGGSPVQSGEIYDAIRALREEYPDTPLIAVAGDTCASGGYYVAAAADEIYANKASIVGSIGVRGGGFGFVDALEKIGVERRLYTAGENKGFLDPFSPEKPEDIAHMEGLLGSIHDQFVSVVKQGRGDRLGDDPRLFTGLVWTGEQGLAMGLIDGLGDQRHVAKTVIGEEKIVDFTPREKFFDQIAKGLPGAMVNAFTDEQSQLLRWR